MFVLNAASGTRWFRYWLSDRWRKGRGEEAVVHCTSGSLDKSYKLYCCLDIGFIPAFQSVMEFVFGLIYLCGAPRTSIMRPPEHLVFAGLQVVLQEIGNILNLAQPIVATLTEVELSEWRLRQQLACIGSPADTCLDHLQKWWELIRTTLALHGSC